MNYRMFNLLQNNIKETAGIVVLWTFPAQTRVLAGCKSPPLLPFRTRMGKFSFFKDIWWEWVILISGKDPPSSRLLCMLMLYFVNLTLPQSLLSRYQYFRLASQMEQYKTILSYNWTTICFHYLDYQFINTTGINIQK